MVIMMSMAAKPEIMGKFIVTSRLQILGWLATAVMALAVLMMAATSLG
jgi:Mn2+/Fe2+ NRAMP family transporter